MSVTAQQCESNEAILSKTLKLCIALLPIRAISAKGEIWIF